jgi:hypothetical protein
MKRPVRGWQNALKTIRFRLKPDQASAKAPGLRNAPTLLGKNGIPLKAESILAGLTAFAAFGTVR